MFLLFVLSATLHSFRSDYTNYFFTGTKFETIFFVFHPSGIFFVLLAATSVLDPMEKNGRIYGRPRCAFKCVLFSMDVWSESSRNLAVNMHGTTCQTSFCINKTSPTLMCGRAQTGNKKDSEHMQHLKVTFQQKLSIC